MGANIRLRPGKSRAAGNEENRSQLSPSTLASGEDYANGTTDSSRNSDWIALGRTNFCNIAPQYVISTPQLLYIVDIFFLLERGDRWSHEEKGLTNFFAYRGDSLTQVFRGWGT